MSDSDWDRQWQLFHAARELPESARAAYLDENTADDPELKKEVEALLAAHRADEADDSIGRGVEAMRRIDTEALLGTTIGAFQLTDVLGEGGMGVVYTAEQKAPLRRRVALKVIKRGMDSNEIIARFESERQALALMSHPSIARALDAGTTEDGRPYFAMEFVPGVPITEYCDRHRLSIEKRIELFIRVCEGVQHAHHKGIIHRDLKPSNVLVIEENDRAEPKIIDFGIAKALTERLTDKTLQTKVGHFIGTLSYMAPEQAESEAQDIDTRADIYSLGVLLYELIVGSRPIEDLGIDATDSASLSRALRESSPPRPSATLAASGDRAAEIARCRTTSMEKLRRDVAGDLDWIIIKALEPDRVRRYSTAEDLARDLKRHFSNEPVTARPPSTSYRIGRFVARHKLAVAAASVVAAGICIGVAGLVTGLIQARESQTVAERERNHAESIGEFLESILAGASPYVAQGADTTLLIELLNDAAKRIDTEIDDPLLAGELHATISRTYRAMGMNDESLVHAQKSLAAIESSDAGPDSAEAIAARGRVALTLWAEGRMEESLALNEQVFESQMKLLGPRHVDTMTTMNNMGIALKALYRYDEAEAIYLDLIDRRTEQLGATHRSTIVTRNNLANLYRDSGRFEEAELWMRDVVRDTEATFGSNDPDTLAFTDSYANILSRLGRHDEAESLHLSVLERSRVVSGPDHPDTLGMEYHLGQLYMAMEKHDLAEAQFRLAYDGISRTLGPRHRFALFSQSWLARSLMAQSRWDEAEIVLRDALVTVEDEHAGDNLELARLECYLGAVLVEIERPDAARELFGRCVPELEAANLTNEELVTARDYLARLDGR